MALRSIVCERGIIEYELTRKLVKNVNLRVAADGSVRVSANRRVPIEFIERFIIDKQDFIINAVERAKARQKQAEEKPQREFTGGEYLNILGRRRDVVLAKGAREQIILDESRICFIVKNPRDTRHKELLYERWLKTYREEIYSQVCRRTYELFKPYGIEYPAVKSRYMTSRWGSCQPYHGKITLNSRLIETPMSCIEYVVLHEFSHFIHPDHSKDFRALMTKFMPDWKERKALLNSITDWN